MKRTGLGGISYNQPSCRLPPHLIRSLSLLFLTWFFKLGDSELSLKRRAASDEEAEGAEGFRLFMTVAKMFYFFLFGGDKWKA